MKSIEQLAREAAESAGRAIVFDDHFKLFAERFHALAIAEEHKRLLEGSGEPIVLTESNDGTPTAYTADQMAAAALRERERCAAIAQRLRGEYMLDGEDLRKVSVAFDALIAEVERLRERERCAAIADKWSKRADDVGGYLAAAIRGQQ